MRKILPLLLLLIGVGAGLGLGVLLRPPAESHDSVETPDAQSKTEEAEDSSAHEFVKLNNQFVVPIIKNDRVSSMVLVSLSLEVKSGYKETVYAQEPKLRDALLQTMFDHANIGGFDGAFTQSGNLDLLKKSLFETARITLGDSLAEVLIIDIARQKI